MPNRAWKNTERRIARYLGTERNPGSGGSNTGTRSDTKHATLYVEVKHGGVARMGWAAAERLFETVRARAAAEGKAPVLVLHARGTAGGVATYPAYVDCWGVVVQVPLRRVREGTVPQPAPSPAPAP
jgi:hypothetical protein